MRVIMTCFLATNFTMQLVLEEMGAARMGLRESFLTVPRTGGWRQAVFKATANESLVQPNAWIVTCLKVKKLTTVRLPDGASNLGLSLWQLACSGRR
jgi:hypothetical protein